MQAVDNHKEMVRRNTQEQKELSGVLKHLQLEEKYAAKQLKHITRYRSEIGQLLTTRRKPALPQEQRAGKQVYWFDGASDEKDIRRQHNSGKVSKSWCSALKARTILPTIRYAGVDTDVSDASIHVSVPSSNSTESRLSQTSHKTNGEMRDEQELKAIFRKIGGKYTGRRVIERRHQAKEKGESRRLSFPNVGDDVKNKRIESKLRNDRLASDPDWSNLNLPQIVKDKKSSVLITRSSPSDDDGVTFPQCDAVRQLIFQTSSPARTPTKFDALKGFEFGFSMQ